MKVIEQLLEIYIAFIHKGRLLFCEEKDALLEQYGTVRMTKERFAELPPEAVMGKRINEYGVEALVKKKEISDAFVVEHTDLEDIILFMVKGEK